jgi:hypothetical protein
LRCSGSPYDRETRRVTIERRHSQLSELRISPVDEDPYVLANSRRIGVDRAAFFGLIAKILRPGVPVFR